MVDGSVDERVLEAFCEVRIQQLRFPLDDHEGDAVFNIICDPWGMLVDFHFAHLPIHRDRLKRARDFASDARQEHACARTRDRAVLGLHAQLQRPTIQMLIVEVLDIPTVAVFFRDGY